MLEGYRKKTICQLVIAILRSWKLLIAALLCIVVTMMSKLPCLQKTGNYSNEWISFVNDTGFSLACSYIAAYFFYILTVLYPSVKRKIPILSIAKEYLRYARDENQHMLKTICGCSDISEERIPEFIKGIVSPNSVEDNICVSVKNCNNILNEMRKTDNWLQKVVPYADYLDEPDLKILKEIIEIVENLDSYIEDKLCGIIDNSQNYTVWGRSELEKLAKRLVKIYQLTDTLYIQLNKNV